MADDTKHKPGSAQWAIATVYSLPQGHEAQIDALLAKLGDAVDRSAKLEEALRRLMFCIDGRRGIVTVGNPRWEEAWDLALAALDESAARASAAEGKEPADAE